MIVQLAKNGSTSRVRKAAAFLARGELFDPCEVDKNTELGPFSLYCVQFLAKKNGCQPAGSAFPTDNNASSFSSKSWTELDNYFAKLRSDSNSEDLDVQKTAVRQCLGINISLPPKIKNTVNGISYFFYNWGNDFDITTPMAPRRMFYGRKKYFEFKDITNEDTFTPDSRVGMNKLHFRIKGKFTTKLDTNMKFFVTTTEGISIRVDSKNVLEKWMEQGSSKYLSSFFSILASKLTDFDIDWYSNTNGHELIIRMIPLLTIEAGKQLIERIPSQTKHTLGKCMCRQYHTEEKINVLNGTDAQVMPMAMLQQQFPNEYPIVRFEFHEARVNDLCFTLDSQPVGSVIVTLIRGKRCAVFSNRDTHIRINNGIYLSAIRSITAMVYLNSASTPARIWEFTNSPFGASWQADTIGAALTPDLKDGMMIYYQQDGGKLENTGADSIKLKEWTHCAWVFNEDMTQLQFLINGELKATITDQTMKNKIYSKIFIGTSVEEHDKDFAIGWFRMFDYSLDDYQLKRDMQSDWHDDVYFKNSEVF
jgi:hypothetical protein